MSYKRDQRRKWQRREQPAGYRAEPKWTVAIPRRLNVPAACHSLAGLPLRNAGTTAHLRTLRLTRFDPSSTPIRRPLTVDEAADKIAVEYGEALAELADQ